MNDVKPLKTAYSKQIEFLDEVDDAKDGLVRYPNKSKKITREFVKEKHKLLDRKK